SDDSKAIDLCKLNDFFSNNIDFELSKISILELNNCDIIEVPRNIQKLNLKQLILTHNNLKEVPSCLYSGLKTLELLDLSHNFIKSFDIEPACSCTIATLKLNDNQIHNFPHWILTLRCPKLVELIYTNNNIVTLKTSHTVNIKKLEMCNCHLLDVDFQFLKAIKTLEYLDISNNNPVSHNENRFKDIDQLFVQAEWKSMNVLKLNNLTISILPPGIFWIMSLSELHLNNCDLSWIPEDVQYLTNLRILDVSYNAVCSLPSQLCHLKNLEVVKAPFNNISSIRNFKNNLEILDLYNNCLETFPNNVDKIKFIDVEQNLFDTVCVENYNEYLEKCKQLRQMFNYTRMNGCKELLEESLPSGNYDKDSLNSESEECTEHYQNQIYEVEFENWDEEKPKVFEQKNPEVTSSDDEWEGKEDINKDKENSKFLKPYFDVNEEWIFCDAEE
ncbi:LRR 8 domain containing protein, partial [Asbolus verrucosus]